MIEPQLVYFLFASLMAAVAAWTACVWFQSRDVNGLAIVVVAAALAVAWSMIGLALSGGEYGMLLAVQRAAWAPAALAVVVLADAYSASKRKTETLLTRSFVWLYRLLCRTAARFSLKKVSKETCNEH